MLQRGLRYHGSCGFCDTHAGWGPEEIPISSCPFILSVKFCSLKPGGVAYFSINFYVNVMIFDGFFLVAWLSWTAIKTQVLMGDLNTGFYQPSQQLLRNGKVDAYGRSWEIPMTFTDAWAELHPQNPDPSTINDDPVRLDTCWEKSKNKIWWINFQKMTWFFFGDFEGCLTPPSLHIPAVSMVCCLYESFAFAIISFPCMLIPVAPDKLT